MDYTYFTVYSDVKEKLKPFVCQSCKDDGCGFQGHCSKCLENQAYNKEYLETHTFITDNSFGSYHDGCHDNIKRLPLRMPGEHPYLYYGIEIEIEFDDSITSVFEYNEYDEAEEATADIDVVLSEFTKITNGLFVYERDGSLQNGVEFISRPCSYAYLTSAENVERLKKGFEYLKSVGAYSDQPTRNGMHIHISRKFFDYGETKLQRRSQAYEDFDWLFQKFQPEFEKLGGREYTEYCRSKADQLKNMAAPTHLFPSNYNVEVKMDCKLKRGGEPGQSHNEAVIYSGHTIEARIFKSTVDYKQVLANVELVRNLAHAVRDGNTQVSLDSLLHTKDNLYLDEVIRNTKRKYARGKDKLNLEKVNDDEIEIKIGE